METKSIISGVLIIILLVILIVAIIIELVLLIESEIELKKQHKFEHYYTKEHKPCKQCKYYFDFKCEDKGKDCHYVYYERNN